MGKGMKAQMVFEFVLATILFFAVVFYIINYLSFSMDAFGRSLYSDRLESRVVQISELLVKNRGVWEGYDPVVLGLAKDWPVLSYDKIQGLNQTCAENYSRIIELLDLGQHSIRIQINESGKGEPLVDCGQFSLGVSRAGVKRFALSEGNEVLVVGVGIL